MSIHTPSGRLLCIAGTDTDAGKSLVTAGLLRALEQLGHKAQAIKPVQTGCLPCAQGGQSDLFISPDVAVYKEAAPLAPCTAFATFSKPCSPHLAARLDGTSIEASSLVDRVRTEADAFAGITLLEGAGGLFVPLNEKECVIDLFVSLNAPMILVAPNRLGTVNHCLLSLEAMARRGLRLFATVLSTTCFHEKGDGLAEAMEKDNPEIIARLAGIPRPLCIPHLPGFHSSDHGDRASAWEALSRSLLPLAEEAAEHD